MILLETFKVTCTPKFTFQLINRTDRAYLIQKFQFCLHRKVFPLLGKSFFAK